MAASGSSETAQLVRPYRRHAAIERLVDQFVDDGLRLAGQPAEAQQRLDRFGVEMSLQPRQQLVADSVSGKAGIGVARIVAIGLAQRVEVAGQVGVADRQQRPDKHGVAQRPCPRHAGKAANARAANDSVQNRLGLIVGGVGRGDEAGAESSGGVFQEAVSRRAGRGFDAVARRHPSRIDVAHLASHSQSATQVDNEAFVLVGVGPQVMVQMGGTKATLRLRFSGPPSPATAPRCRPRPKRPAARSHRPSPRAATLRRVWFPVNGSCGDGS